MCLIQGVVQLLAYLDSPCIHRKLANNYSRYSPLFLCPATLKNKYHKASFLLSLEKVRFRKLRDDFEYNLKLLEERDGDLAKYEKLFEQFKGNDDLSNRKVSDMKIRIDEFQSKLALVSKVNFTSLHFCHCLACVYFTGQGNILCYVGLFFFSQLQAVVDPGLFLLTCMMYMCTEMRAYRF